MIFAGGIVAEGGVFAPCGKIGFGVAWKENIVKKEKI